MRIVKKYPNAVNKPISVYKIEVRWMAGDGDFYESATYSAFHDDKFLEVLAWLIKAKDGSGDLTHDQQVEAEAMIGGQPSDNYGIHMSVDSITPYWYDSQGTRHGVEVSND